MVGVQSTRIVSFMESLQPFVREPNAYEYTLIRIALQGAGTMPCVRMNSETEFPSA